MTSTTTSTRKISVRAARQVAEGVRCLDLEPADGGPVEEWSPGAHIDVHLPGGMVRQYSLCGDPADSQAYRIAVLREPQSRGGSIAIHEAVEPGMVLEIGGPRNHFALAEASRYLFIAGGIGITPILPMVRRAAASGAEWTLLYGGRRRASMAFLDELACHGNRVVVRPQDEYGILDLPSWLGTPREDTAVYCCGPEPLLHATQELCRAWPAGALRIERFTAPAADLGGDSAHASDGALDEADIICDASGVTVRLERGQSIVEALRAAGISVPTSCEEGICGTCETTVLGGGVAHRDLILSDEERAAGDVAMICVSRPSGPALTLDI
jgi:ferredoxin-NADP reductase